MQNILGSLYLNMRDASQLSENISLAHKDTFYAVNLSEDSDNHFHVVKYSEFPLSKDYLEGQTFTTDIRLIYLNGKQIWSYWVRGRDNDASLKQLGII